LATGSRLLADGGLRARVNWIGLVAWLLGGAATTLLLWLLRDELDKAHMALAYLVLVLLASSRQGRLVGLLVALLSFLSFNFFLLPPYYTFVIADPLDWGVLVAFLVSGGIAAELFHRQQLATALAERRAREVSRLGTLGAESLSVGRAAEAVDAIVRVILAELPVTEAKITLRPHVEHGDGDHGERATLRSSSRAGIESQDLESFVVRERRIASRRADGTTHVEPAPARLADVLERARGESDLLVPLTVRDRCLGVLWLSDPQGLRFDAAQATFADALAYYAALAAERVRLAGEAERVEALREADRLKDALLASVSHDLRTPLTTIRATASELRQEGEERGALIEEEADRLNRLVADLLDLSRLRAGVLPLSPEINAAEDLVGAALQRLGGTPGAGDVRVSLPSSDSIAVGRFDFSHSLRALTNLLENALRHSPSPGTVELEVRTEGDVLHFDVLDQGPGVAPHDRSRLFEPFFRSASSAGVQGTGLGLTIAARIAEAQGGAVTYAPRPGGGSIFSLRLPAADLLEMS